MEVAPRTRRKIAVMVPVEYEYSRQIVLGAAKYCVSHGMAIFHTGVIAKQHIAQLKEYGVVGIVGMIIDEEIREAVQKMKIAAVNVSSRIPNTGIPTVIPDHEEIGRMAAAHLVERGFRNLAYCGMQGHWYSEARGAGFAKAVKAARVNYSELDTGVFNWNDFHRSTFAKALREAPRPLAVMCANDIRARHLLEACDAAGLRVPQDVAIVGVDNDQVICQGLDPMLTSVDPNGYRIGYDAVAALDRILAGKSVPDRTLVPPLGIVPRASTNTTPSEDARVGKALEYIHAHADKSINVMDVANRVGASRRTLERHFRTTLGKSVAGAIRSAHVELAKQLLIDTDLTLEEVAESSGMNYLRQMRIVFTKEVGVSPSQFRRQFKGG